MGRRHEQTLVLIKPGAVKRGHIGHILSRFEDRGMKIVAMKMMTVSPDLSDKHYVEHIEKPFYHALQKFITSGPVVAMVIESEYTVDSVRLMVGVTNAANAAPGTIRGDYSVSGRANAVHASDSVENAEREIGLFFPELK
jgi:nucleoside-diphosphate kinase